MDLQDYRAARHRRLVEMATELGVPADRAAAVVDRVIEDQRRRIVRSADPDQVVVPALREEVLGGRSRRPLLGVVLVAGVAAAFAVTILTGPPDPEKVERRAATAGLSRAFMAAVRPRRMRVRMSSASLLSTSSRSHQPPWSFPSAAVLAPPPEASGRGAGPRPRRQVSHSGWPQARR